MSAHSPGRLLLDEPAPGVTRLTVSHPARRGALDRAILDAIADTLPRLEARCVIITGEGGDFSAGYDITGLGGHPAQADGLVAAPYEAALQALDTHPEPILAAVGGPALGGGLELALACDLRIASEEARFGMPPARLGLVYSHTGIARFIEAIGAPRTRELFLTGESIDAVTARGWGLVNRVFPAERLPGAALELAGRIAAGAPLARRGNRRVIDAVARARGEISPPARAELEELRRVSLRSDDFREGVRAFAEKRAPQWRGR